MTDRRPYSTTILPDHLEAMEYLDAAGWTDGLPVVPPSPDLVDAMLAAGHRRASDVLGALPQRSRALTAWQAATFAVMAGCRPAFFPVVLATWEALFDPHYNLHAALSSTGGAAIAAVVSGPYAADISMNAGRNVLGPGNRANATIGRAVRLGAMVALGATADELDASTFGHAGKYTMHFAEQPPPSPWSAVHVQLGYPPGTTSVTVLAAEAGRQVIQNRSASPEDLLRTLAACMRNPSQNGTGRGTYYMIVLGPEHAGTLVGAGWSQQEVRAFLSRASRVRVEELQAASVAVPSFDPDGNGSTDGFVTVEPADILLVTAGGGGAGFSLAIPAWSTKSSTHPASRPVVVPGTPTAQAVERPDRFGHV